MFINTQTSADDTMDWEYCDPVAEKARQDEIKFIESVSLVFKIDRKLIDWEYVSRLDLSESQLEAFKDALIWKHVSRKISITTAFVFREYVDWYVFWDSIERYTISKLDAKIRTIRTEPEYVGTAIIDLEKFNTK